jgi:hypothetical protein
MGHEPSALAGRSFLDFPRTQSLNPLFQPHRPARAGKTMRERSMAKGRLAQLVEHCVHIAGVTGSSPVPPTIKPLKSCNESTNSSRAGLVRTLRVSAVSATQPSRALSSIDAQSAVRLGSDNNMSSNFPTRAPKLRSLHERQNVGEQARRNQEDRH